MNIRFEEKYLVHKKISDKNAKEIYGEDFNALLGDLLYVRGIRDAGAAEEFVNPKWENNHDPFLFNDMKKTVQRILTAIEKKEKILIFSDYDTDGIPGGAVLYNFFKKIEYPYFQNYIPNRNRDGYGLTEKAAEKIAKGEIFKDSLFGETETDLNPLESEEFLPSLVITIDCGITDLAAAKILKKGKIDLIVTDHHLPKDTLPDAYAILDHKVVGEKYPDKNLCGAGVIYKVVQALVSEIQKNKSFDIQEGWEKWLLDLVSISTVCDMVPLLGENRIFVKYGQVVFKNTHRAGLNRVITKARLDKKNISAGDLGFMIGPRVNAAARLEDPKVAFDMLAKDGEEAESSADYLEKLNNRRKYLTAKIMKDVWGKLAEREESEVIVIGNKDWPLGVLGLIAGKVADKYKKPAFVWSQADGESTGVLKGSCRSGGIYSVHSLMNQAADEFIGFGGHTMSGGFVIAEENIHYLQENLSEALQKTEKIEDKKIILDAELSLDDVTIDNYRQIEKLEPYGMENQKPHFLFADVEIFHVKEFGKNKEHLELSFKNSRNYTVKAMTFYYADALEDRKFVAGEKIQLVASFDMNRWNGNEFLRLKIEDIF